MGVHEKPTYRDIGGNCLKRGGVPCTVCRFNEGLTNAHYPHYVHHWKEITSGFISFLL